jgi:hypothetical protein
MPYLGRIDATPLHNSVRMANRKSREQLSFEPKYPTYRDGYPAVIEQWEQRRS